MILRVLAPTIEDLLLVPGASVVDPEAYQSFWRRAQTHLDEHGFESAPVIETRPHRGADWDDDGHGDPRHGEREAMLRGGSWAPLADRLAHPTVVFHHCVADDPFNRYQTIDQSSMERPLEVVRILVPRSSLASIADEEIPPDRYMAKELLEHIELADLALHDHGAALLELTIDVGHLLDDPGEHGVARRLDDIQLGAVWLAQAVADVVHRSFVAPLLAQLRQVDGHGDVLMPPMTALPSGKVMWAARALVFPHVEPAEDDGPSGDQVVSDHHKTAITHWIKDAPLSADEEPDRADVQGNARRLEEQLVRGEIDHLARWLNYAFVVPPDRSETEATSMGHGGAFADDWTALRLAQHFYAALDLVDGQLSDILARSLGVDSMRQLSSLQAQLERTSRRAQLVTMQRRDVSKYLKRSVLAEMDQILGLWAFAELAEGSVAEKLTACRERLDDLKSKREHRSGLVTDIILFTIGITAILGTALAMAEFGRVSASDPNLAGYDLGRSNLSAWFASQPVDTILLISVVVSVLLIVAYVLFRPRNDA